MNFECNKIYVRDLGRIVRFIVNTILDGVPDKIQKYMSDVLHIK